MKFRSKFGATTSLELIFRIIIAFSNFFFCWANRIWREYNHLFCTYVKKFNQNRISTFCVFLFEPIWVVHWKKNEWCYSHNPITYILSQTTFFRNGIVHTMTFTITYSLQDGYFLTPIFFTPIFFIFTAIFFIFYTNFFHFLQQFFSFFTPIFFIFYTIFFSFFTPIFSFFTPFFFVFYTNFLHQFFYTNLFYHKNFTFFQKIYFFTPIFSHDDLFCFFHTNFVTTCV